jgi:hypothetical protein
MKLSHALTRMAGYAYSGSTDPFPATRPKE